MNKVGIKTSFVEMGQNKELLEICLPFSFSCHTMPSSVTAVPGSQGPKQSGSVTVPTLVPIQTSCVVPD